jgi:hypothetical protein
MMRTCLVNQTSWVLPPILLPASSQDIGTFLPPSCLADFLLDGSENKIFEYILLMFFPVSRAVPLKNGHSEELELSSLLVKVSRY